MRNRLAEARKNKGFTQEALAKASGVSRPYISDIERGSQNAVTNIVMYKIASALNEKVEDIFFTNDVV